MYAHVCIYVGTMGHTGKHTHTRTSRVINARWAARWDDGGFIRSHSGEGFNLKLNGFMILENEFQPLFVAANRPEMNPTSPYVPPSYAWVGCFEGDYGCTITLGTKAPLTLFTETFARCRHWFHSALTRMTLIGELSHFVIAKSKLYSVTRSDDYHDGLFNLVI